MNLREKIEQKICDGNVLGEGGRWVSVEQKKRQRNEFLSHLEKGEVLFKGEWITIAEKRKRISHPEIPFEQSCPINPADSESTPFSPEDTHILTREDTSSFPHRSKNGSSASHLSTPPLSKDINSPLSAVDTTPLPDNSVTFSDDMSEKDVIPPPEETRLLALNGDDEVGIGIPPDQAGYPSQFLHANKSFFPQDHDTRPVMTPLDQSSDLPADRQQGSGSSNSPSPWESGRRKRQRTIFFITGIVLLLTVLGGIVWIVFIR